MARCPQCGVEFERGAAEFCPNSNCGFPVAFMDEDLSGTSHEAPEMVRQPGEGLPTEMQPTERSPLDPGSWTPGVPPGYRGAVGASERHVYRTRRSLFWDALPYVVLAALLLTIAAVLLAYLWGQGGWAEATTATLGRAVVLRPAV